MSQAVLSFAVTGNPELLLERLLPDIRDAVSTACYHYFGSQCGMEDFYQQVLLLLVEDDYRRLQRLRNTQLYPAKHSYLPIRRKL